MIKISKIARITKAENSDLNLLHDLGDIAFLDELIHQNTKPEEHPSPVAIYSSIIINENVDNVYKKLRQNQQTKEYYVTGPVSYS